MDIVGFTSLFSTRIVAYGCCLSLYVSVLSDGKTLPAVAVSCLCGLRVFRRCKRFSPFSRMWISALVSLLFLCAAPGRRCRAEWDAVPHPAGALPPSPPRATAPLDGRNALRGRFSRLCSARRQSFFAARTPLGSAEFAVRRTSAELGAGARPCRGQHPRPYGFS